MSTLPKSLFEHSFDRRSHDRHSLDESAIRPRPRYDNYNLSLAVENELPLGFDESVAVNAIASNSSGHVSSEHVSSEQMQRPSVLVVGKLIEEEFPSIQSLLEVAADVVFIEESDNNATAAVECLRKAENEYRAFDLVIYAQPRQAISLKAHQQIAEAIEKSAQETDLVQLLGTWCEGEGRTGKVPEGWQRIFWHAWPRWSTRWLIYWSNRGTDARLVNHESLNSLSQTTTTTNQSLRIVEAMGDSDLISALHAALLPHQFYVVPSVPGKVSKTKDALEGQIAGIWIGKQLSGSEAERLRGFCLGFQKSTTIDSISGSNSVPVVALLDFPRRETVQSAQTIGAADVLGLPCDTLDLVHALEHAIAKCSENQTMMVPSRYEKKSSLEDAIRAA